MNFHLKNMNKDVKRFRERKYLLLIILSIMFVLSIIVFSTNSYLYNYNVTLSGKDKFFFEENNFLKVDFKITENSGIDVVKGKEKITVIPNKIGRTNAEVLLFGLIKLKNIEVSVVDEEKIYAVGRTVGIRLFLNGLLVEALSSVDTIDGKKFYPAKDIGIKKGDIIFKANSKILKTTEDLIKVIDENKGQPLLLKISRNSEIIDYTLTPIISIDKKYHIGLWLRDTINGIGTLTFYNKKTKQFATLGHGISDDSGDTLVPIKGGVLFETEIATVKKGERGTPGELKGNLLMDYNIIGEVHKNSSFGVFGQVYEEFYKNSAKEEYLVGYKESVREGEAFILSNIEGKKVEKFNIEIEKIVNRPFGPPYGMIIKITDERLKNLTGGIVQGMSGSPIIQKNRIIGAVTHVMVNDPLKGYGVFIENMLKILENQNKGNNL